MSFSQREEVIAIILFPYYWANFFPLKRSNQLQNILRSDLLKSGWKMDSKDCLLFCLLVIYKQVLTVVFFFQKNREGTFYTLCINLSDSKVVSYLLKTIIMAGKLIK